VTVPPSFLSRTERFDRVGSTNDVVRDWLADGTPEVCLAVAGEQTAGRGREGRTWVAPPGAALLLSVGFRPAWLAPDRSWRLPAIVSLAMAGAAESAAGLPNGTVRLKWPNDLVIEATDRDGDPVVRKLAGVLGESVGLGTDDPRVVVGIGINASWNRDDFPPELGETMTSLSDASGGGGVAIDGLLDAFLGRLEQATERLRLDAFDAADWRARQVTTGRDVALQGPDGRVDVVRALGVDDRSGALVVDGDHGERPVYSGEIRHLRLSAAGFGV